MQHSLVITFLALYLDLPDHDAELLETDGTATQMRRTELALVYRDVHGVHTDSDTLEETTSHQELIQKTISKSTVAES